MANLYAPLYNSLQARGRMSPLGAPGAIKPEKKKKGLGDKMAGALGSMIDEAMNADKVSKKERHAQLVKRNKQLLKQHKGMPDRAEPTPGVSPIITTELPGMNGEIITLNPDYVPAYNPRESGSYAGEPSALEMEYFDNLQEIKSLEGTETKSSGFKDETKNNQILYPNYESRYFDKQPTARNNSGTLSKFLRFI